VRFQSIRLFLPSIPIKEAPTSVATLFPVRVGAYRQNPKDSPPVMVRSGAARAALVVNIIIELSRESWPTPSRHDVGVPLAFRAP
jgi:hypothetical protein